MTPDERAMLRAITAQPGDDLPRLIFADWLDEHGDHAWAEFIRLQIARYQLPSTHPEIRSLAHRECALLATHETRWRARLPEALRANAGFRRGLIYRLNCTSNELARSAPLLTEIVDPIEVLAVQVDELELLWFATTLRLSHLPLHSLQLSCPWQVGSALLEVLARSGPYPYVKKLRLNASQLGDVEITASIAPEVFPALEELEMTHSGLGDRTADELADSPWVGRLQRLCLRGHRFSPAAATLLRERFGAVWRD